MPDISRMRLKMWGDSLSCNSGSYLQPTSENALQSTPAAVGKGLDNYVESAERAAGSHSLKIVVSNGHGMGIGHGTVNGGGVELRSVGVVQFIAFVGVQTTQPNSRNCRNRNKPPGVERSHSSCRRRHQSSPPDHSLRSSSLSQCCPAG